MGFGDFGRPKPPEPAPEPAEKDVDFLRWGMELRRELAESISGVMLRGARPVAVGTTEGATKNVALSTSAMVGFALTNESDDDTVTVRVLFRDGFNTDADVIMKISLAPGESTRDWFHPGIHLQNGLYVDADGPISGSVFMRGAE